MNHKKLREGLLSLSPLRASAMCADVLATNRKRFFRDQGYTWKDEPLGNLWENHPEQKPESVPDAPPGDKHKLFRLQGKPQFFLSESYGGNQIDLLDLFIFAGQNNLTLEFYSQIGIHHPGSCLSAIFTPKDCDIEIARLPA